MKRVLFLSLVLAAPAFAQDVEEVDTIVYPKAWEIEFDVYGVNATGERPSGAIVLERRREVFNPLIHLRTEFNDAMAESVGEVK